MQFKYKTSSFLCSFLMFMKLMNEPVCIVIVEWTRAAEITLYQLVHRPIYYVITCLSSSLTEFGLDDHSLGSFDDTGFSSESSPNPESEEVNGIDVQISWKPVFLVWYNSVLYNQKAIERKLTCQRICGKWQIATHLSQWCKCRLICQACWQHFVVGVW